MYESFDYLIIVLIGILIQRRNGLQSEQVLDRTYMIFEGIRQYVQYVSQHKLKMSPIVSQLNPNHGHTVEIPIERSDKTGFSCLRFVLK